MTQIKVYTLQGKKILLWKILFIVIFKMKCLPWVSGVKINTSTVRSRGCRSHSRPLPHFRQCTEWSAPQASTLYPLHSVLRLVFEQAFITCQKKHHFTSLSTRQPGYLKISPTGDPQTARWATAVQPCCSVAWQGGDPQTPGKCSLSLA